MGNPPTLPGRLEFGKTVCHSIRINNPLPADGGKAFRPSEIKEVNSMKYLKTSPFPVAPGFPRRLFLTLLVITAAVGVSNRSLAQLPLATFELAAYGANPVFAPGTLSLEYTTATITQGLDPYLSASMAYPNLTEGTIFATSASMKYYFEVHGTGTVANVTVVANGAASLGSVAMGEAEAYIYVGSVLSETASVSTSSTSATASFTLDETLSLPVNTEQEVQLYASVGDYGQSVDSPAIGSASVDPQISLAAGQSGDTLVFSSNFLPVPEPSTAAMLALGGAALLCVRRLRARGLIFALPCGGRFRSKQPCTC